MLSGVSQSTHHSTPTWSVPKWLVHITIEDPFYLEMNFEAGMAPTLLNVISDFWIGKWWLCIALNSIHPNKMSSNHRDSPSKKQCSLLPPALWPAERGKKTLMLGNHSYKRNSRLIWFGPTVVDGKEKQRSLTTGGWLCLHQLHPSRLISNPVVRFVHEMSNVIDDFWETRKEKEKGREEKVNGVNFCFVLCCYLPLLRLHCVFFLFHFLT